PLTENAGGAALKGLRDEDVAVMLLAPERDKQPAWFYLPRVGKKLSERDILSAAQHAPTRRLHDLLHRHTHSTTILAPPLQPPMRAANPEPCSTTPTIICCICWAVLPLTT